MSHVRSRRLAPRSLLLALIVVLAASFAWAAQVTFRYVPPPGLDVTSVSLRGTMNDWGETAMTQGADGAWTVTLELAPDIYQYKFFINGQWPHDMCHDTTYGQGMVDPTADGCVDDGYGGGNAIKEIKAPVRAAGGTAPALDLQFDASSPEDVSRVGDALAVRFEAGEGSVASATVEALGSAHAGDPVPMVRQAWSQGRETWLGWIPADSTRVALHITEPDGTTHDVAPAALPQHPFTAVPWVGRSVGYQIFPERFWNGDPSNDALALKSDEYNFNPLWSGPKPFVSPSWTSPPSPTDLCCHQYYGGDLQGILDRLDQLAAEGVTALYINPIDDAGSAHGYDTNDYMKVAPHLGTLKVLKQLLAAAHAKGMHVIFDFVPNHTGIGFWAFQDVVKNGPNSPYWNWYFIKTWPFQPGDASAYNAWWNVPSLPKLNTGNPGVRSYLIQVARYWMTVGFDGIRVDVPGDIIDAPSFFEQLRATIKPEFPQAYLVGEIWQNAPSWLQGDQFDSLMNYAIGRDVLLRYAQASSPLFGGRWALTGLSKIYQGYPVAVAAMGFNLIDSHDTSRLLTDLGGGDFGATPDATALARQKLASALLYALPGMPVSFQGDECALLGQKDGDLERYPVQWSSCDADMVAHYRTLARMRGRYPALTSPTWLAYAGEGPVLAFLRGEPGVGQVLAVFNQSTDAAELTLPAGGWQDPTNLRTYHGKVDIPAIGWRYLVRRN